VVAHIPTTQIDFTELPAEIQTEIQGADQLFYNQFHGLQYILGLKDGKFIFDLVGQMRILSKKFEPTSYGSDNWQWCWSKGLIQ